MSKSNSTKSILMLHLFLIDLSALLVFTVNQTMCQVPQGTGEVFSKKNLAAWCIVPFDNKKRGPEERAQMLDKLGITKFAYDWREEHVSSFDEEMNALKKHHIELQAFWMPYGPDPAKNKHYSEIFALLHRHNIKTQLWWSVWIVQRQLEEFDPGGESSCCRQHGAYHGRGCCKNKMHSRSV